MNTEVWIAFVIAVAVFCLIPGPTVVLVIGQSIVHGKKSVVPLLSGVLCGDFVAMSLSILGLGAVLATSSVLFSALKWFGAVYLIYLGIKTWRSELSRNLKNVSGKIYRRVDMFKSAFLVTALNPKDIVFFVAFFPQFINQNGNELSQLAILMVTFLSIVACNIAFYTFFAGTLRSKIQSYQAQKFFNRTGGGALICAGAITSTIKQ